MKKELKWRLQRFSDGDGAGADGNGGGAEGNGGGEKPLNFEEFLSQEGNQAEFDRRVQKAVVSAVAKEKEKWKALTDDKLSEAERLAKMNKDEKEKYLRDKERKAFEAEKAAFEKEKLLVQVTKELQEKSLPIAFAESLVAAADANAINKAILEIKEAWDAEITEAVKSKARQKTPEEGGSGVDHVTTKADIRKMAENARII